MLNALIRTTGTLRGPEQRDSCSGLWVQSRRTVGRTRHLPGLEGRLWCGQKEESRSTERTESTESARAWLLTQKSQAWLGQRGAQLSSFLVLAPAKPLGGSLEGPSREGRGRFDAKNNNCPNVTPNVSSRPSALPPPPPPQTGCQDRAAVTKGLVRAQHRPQTGARVEPFPL